MAAVKKAIPVDIKRKVLYPLVPLIDRSSEYRERLLQSGFQAFLPYERYKESFCEAQDIQAHLLYMREKAKESLGRVGIFSPLLTGEGLGYRSPVLEELRRQRDARIGCNFREARQRQIPAFELEIDPCERRYVQIPLLDQPYRAQEEERQLQERRLLAIEAQRHASGLALSYAMDKPDKLAFFYEVMTRELAPNGLEYTKRFSTKYPVFSKELGNGWYLCWGLEDTDVFWIFGNEGSLDLIVYVCHKAFGKTRPGLSKDDYFLRIRYEQFVPSFPGVYRSFTNLDELELIVKAHVRLYGMVNEHIEAAIADSGLLDTI